MFVIWGRAKGGGGRGWPFQAEMYFNYTNRGAHIYLAPGGNTPCSALFVVYR